MGEKYFTFFSKIGLDIPIIRGNVRFCEECVCTGVGGSSVSGAFYLVHIPTNRGRYMLSLGYHQVCCV